MFNFSFVKTILLFTSLFLVLTTTGCGGGSESNPPPAEPQTTSSMQLPVGINASTLPVNGALHAYISVDGGSRQELSVDLGAQTVSGSLNGISPGNHIFIIEVVFIYNDNTEVMLGSANISMDVSTGNNSLAVTSGDYDTTFDDDGDGVSNLAEMNTGTDPNNPADTDCVIGTSKIGSCVLG